MTASTFMRDLFDCNARPRTGETILDVLKIGIPVIVGSIAPIAGPLSSLLDQVPGAARALRFAVPIVLFAVCVHIIRDKRIVARPPGFETTADEQEYRFGQPSRLVAKVALLPLAALALFQGYAGAPNWLSRQSSLSGYVCLANGVPVDRSTTVDAVDADGYVVSRESVMVDDNGFFVIAYLPWARRATSLTIGDGKCGKRSVPLSAATEGLHCAADTLPPPSARSRRSLWSVACAQ